MNAVNVPAKFDFRSFTRSCDGGIEVSQTISGSRCGYAHTPSPKIL